MGWFGKAVSWVFGGGGGGVITQSLDIAKEYIEDVDKRNEVMGSIIIAQAELDGKTTIPWVDALHKMGRQLMQFGLIGFYAYSWHIGQPIDLQDLAVLAVGPGLYTFMKGKGG